MAEKARIPAALSLDGLGDDARAAFDLAAATGYRGVAIPTNHAQTRPGELGTSGARHLLRTLAARGLRVESIRAAAPRGGLADPTTIERTMDNARAAIHMAFDLRAAVVSLHVGFLPGANAADAGRSGGVSPATLAAAGRELAEEADRAGVTLALGSDSGEGLAALLKSLAYERARANLKSADLVAAGEDPLLIAGKLGDAIGQWTAADAVRAGRSARMVELGAGQVPVAELAELLREQGFAGPVVVEVRELADKRHGAERAAQVLARLLGGRSSAGL